LGVVNLQQSCRVVLKPLGNTPSAGSLKTE
jgi:hypothetical protein